MRICRNFRPGPQAPALVQTRGIFHAPRPKKQRHLPVIPASIAFTFRTEQTVRIDLPVGQIEPFLLYLGTAPDRCFIIAHENQKNFVRSSAPDSRQKRTGLLVMAKNYKMADAQVEVTFEIVGRCIWNNLIRSNSGAFFGIVEESMQNYAPKFSGALRQARQALLDTTSGSVHFRKLNATLKTATTPKALIERLLAHIQILRVSVEEFWQLMEIDSALHFVNFFSTLVQYTKIRLTQEGGPQLGRVLQHLNGAPRSAKQAVIETFEKLDDGDTSARERKKAKDKLNLFAHFPWSDSGEIPLDVQNLSLQLHRSHVGLTQIKRTMVEAAAARNLQSKNYPTERYHGKPICLVGVPGTGRTTLVESFAEGLGLPFVHIEAGKDIKEEILLGTREDEDQPSPGIFTQKMIDHKTKALVVLFDRLEKIPGDGEIYEVLSRIIDPNHNHSIEDRFLETTIDLSHCFFFFATLDASEIPHYLYNQLDFFEFEAFSPEEKVRIAQRVLIPKAMRSTGLPAGSVIFPPEILTHLVNENTFEEGVADLESLILKTCRSLAASLSKNGVGNKPIRVNHTLLTSTLGPMVQLKHPEIWKPEIGVIPGLATYGSIGKLLRLESTVYPASGATDLRVTGLADEMFAESVRCARSCLLGHYDEISTFFQKRKRQGLKLEIPQKEVLAQQEMHFHFPQAAVPKSGTSAGLGSFLAISSKVFNTPPAENLAVTGEITLNGLVQAIGGVGEKIDGAIRAGVKTLVFPKENETEVAHFLRRLSKARKTRFSQVSAHEIQVTSATNPREKIVTVILVSNYLEALKAVF